MKTTIRTTLIAALLSLAGLGWAAETRKVDPAAGGTRPQEDHPEGRLIRIDASFVEYRLADIEPLVQEGRVSVETLKELWRSGKGRLLAAPTVTTPSGQEAVAKSVVEVIYPTAYRVATQSGTNTAVATQSTMPGTAVSACFATRETGTMLQAGPEVTVDLKQINVTLSACLVRAPEWHGYEVAAAEPGGKTEGLKVEQPFFPVVSLSTTLKMRNGVTLLAGGGVVDAGGDKTVYLFVTAALVDTNGMPGAAPKARAP